MTSKPDKRRSPRVAIESGGHGRLKATVPVQIMDVSDHGMQLELAAALRPGSTYELRAQLKGIEVNALVRITRCRAGGYVPDGKGGRLLLFRAGAEFVQLEGDRVQEFRDWVQSQAAAAALLHPED